MLAAELRQHFGVDGLTIEQAHRFRDKEAMKVALDAAGIRTPRHVAADSVAACWEASEIIGFPTRPGHKIAYPTAIHHKTILASF